MIIGVVKETFPGERRVALVPGVLPQVMKVGAAYVAVSEHRIQLLRQTAIYGEEPNGLQKTPCLSALVLSFGCSEKLGFQQCRRA